MKIIINLRPMSLIKFAHSFQFYNNLSKTNEVCFIGLLQFYAIIFNCKFLLSFVRNLLTLELNLKCFLIDSFKKTWTKPVIYLKSSTNYLIAFIFKYNHGAAYSFNS